MRHRKINRTKSLVNRGYYRLSAMNDHSNHNGHNGHNGGHPGVPSGRIENPYFEALTGTKPKEIVDFEMNTEPYANMPPNMSRVHMTQSLARGLRPGRRPVIAAVSLLIILAFVLPVVLNVLAQLIH